MSRFSDEESARQRSNIALLTEVAESESKWTSLISDMADQDVLVEFSLVSGTPIIGNVLSFNNGFCCVHLIGSQICLVSFDAIVSVQVAPAEHDTNFSIGGLADRFDSNESISTIDLLRQCQKGKSVISVRLNNTAEQFAGTICQLGNDFLGIKGIQTSISRSRYIPFNKICVLKIDAR